MSEIKFASPDFEKFTLPSNGYGPQGLKELWVRPMTLREEKLLTNKTLVRSGKVQEEIFKACVRDGVTIGGEKVTVDWSKFLAEDEFGLFLFVRAISYGRDYELKVTCPHCNKKTDIVVDLEKDVDVKYADASIANGVTITMPVSKKVVTLRLPTRGDISDDVYKTIANCIVTTDGIEKAIVPVWLESLVARDISELRRAINLPGFGVSKNILFRCGNDKCDSEGEEQKVGLPITAEFFRISTE